MYLLLLHDLEDVDFYATKDKALFDEACNADELCEFISEHSDELEYLGDNIAGITVTDITYGLQY